MLFVLRCDGLLKTVGPAGTLSLSLLPALCKMILVSAIGMNTLNTMCHTLSIHFMPAPVSISRLVDHSSGVERIDNTPLPMPG